MMENYIIALFFFLGLGIGVNLAVFTTYFYFKRAKDLEIDELFAFHKSQPIEDLVREAKEKVAQEEAKNENDEPISVTTEGMLRINLVNIQDKIEQETINEFSSIEKFKTAAREAIAHHTEKEEYKRAGNVQKHLETVDEWFNERKNWFIQMVGSTLKIDKQVCDCSICTANGENEYEVNNETTALKLFIEELKYKVKGEPVYFVKA